MKSQKNKPASHNIELFNIYKAFLEKKLFQNETMDIIPNILFKNILFTALQVGQNGWAKKYVEKYSKYLEETHRKNLYYLGLAFIYESVCDYEKSLDALNQIKLDKFPYMYDIYNLKLMLFYDLGYYEQLNSLAHSFKEYLRTNQVLSEQRKEKNKSFIKLIKMMVFAKNKHSKTDIDYIRNVLLQNIDTMDYEWVTKRLEELEKGNKKNPFN